jgi:septal ring factor EnvC (AmiA/AmiB activator)
LRKEINSLTIKNYGVASERERKLAEANQKLQVTLNENARLERQLNNVIANHDTLTKELKELETQIKKSKTSGTKPANFNVQL